MSTHSAWRRAGASGGYHPAFAVGFQRVFGTLFRVLLRVRVLGRDHVPTTGGVILAGNHTGWLDGPLVFLYSPRPARFLTKAEVFGHPLVARALGWLGQIPVHRGQPDRAALRTALDVLAAGGVVGVFPEGTRGAGTLSSVQHGVAYLAVKSGCPVVPVSCTGAVEALPPGRVVPRPRTPVSVRYGPPVSVRLTGDPRSRRTVSDAAEQIRAALHAHLAGLPADAPAPVLPLTARRGR